MFNDARSGRKLWEYFAGAGVDAPAVTFALDGRQYVAVAAGGSRYADMKGSAVLVFALGSGSVNAPSASPYAPPRPAADTPDAGMPPLTRAGEFVSYSSAARLAVISLVAGQGGRNRGMNFSGGFAGNRTLTVPLGWIVSFSVSNVDVAGHSAIVIANAPLSEPIPSQPALSGAATSHLTDGLAARTGRETVTFAATTPGTYLVACGVSGHAASGMWIRMVVSTDAGAPSYR